jgi:guanylate kinase
LNKPIIVISGPSGVGKTTLCERLLKQERRVKACITATTRAPRADEKNGLDYHFVSTEQFTRWIKQKQLIEYTKIFGAFYGTPLKSLKAIFRQGKYPLLRIDVRGAKNLKASGYQGIYIFIRPPALKTLEARLRKRAARDKKQLTQLRIRLKRVKQELKMSRYYDFQVVNDRLSRAVKEIKVILSSQLFNKKL